MIRVLTIDSEFESAKRIGFNNVNTYLYGNAEQFDKDVIIRWGNSIKYNNNKRKKYTDFKNVLNPADSIHFNCTKNEALAKLSKVVNTPKIYQAGEKVPKNKLVVYRRTEHSGGEGFNVVKGGFVVEPGRYATEFIKTDAEFRVWFCNGKMFRCKRVTIRPERLKAKYKCRSLYGYKFLNDVPKKLNTDIKRAFKALKLEFGAADILFKNNKYYFCELNTSPSLDHKLINTFYKVNILKLIKKRFPNQTKNK